MSSQWQCDNLYLTVFMCSGTWLALRGITGGIGEHHCFFCFVSSLKNYFIYICSFLRWYPRNLPKLWNTIHILGNITYYILEIIKWKWTKWRHLSTIVDNTQLSEPMNRGTKVYQNPIFISLKFLAWGFQEMLENS